jgi:hypothetical protein
MIKLSELEEFFSKIDLPTEIRLNNWTTITDVPKCINSHIETLKNNPGNKAFMPYYIRLLHIYSILKTNK